MTKSIEMHIEAKFTGIPGIPQAPGGLPARGAMGLAGSSPPRAK